jgi:hypothetical protein
MLNLRPIIAHNRRWSLHFEKIFPLGAMASTLLP